MGAASVVSHALARSTFAILLPAIESELLSNRQESGLLGSSNFLAYLLAVGLVTTISGRVEPIRLMVGGLTIAVVGFLVLAAADGVPTLSLGQALTGAASAGIWMSAPTIATAAAPADKRGMVMGFMSSCMGLGILLAGQWTNLVRVVTDDDQAWRPTWLAAAAFTVVVLLVMVLVVRVPETARVQGTISLAHLKTVPRWFTLATSYWLFGFVVSSFTAFFGLLLKDEGFSARHITNLLSALGLAAVFGAITLGRVSDRVGRSPVLTGSMAVIAAASALSLTGREPFAAIAILGFGAASFTFPVLVAAYLRDHLEDRAFSNALGALTMIYGSALILGPTVAGTVADSRLGLSAVFIGLAILSLAAAAGAVVLPRARNQTAEVVG